MTKSYNIKELNRKNLCEPMDIPVTSTLFTSDFSTHIARKIGFETNVAYRYAQ